MSLARGMERRLEQLVDGMAARLFRGRMTPVELASLLVRQADLALRAGTYGPGAPNAVTVTLGGEPAEPEARAQVEAELAAVVFETAVERGWRLAGPVRVRLVVGSGSPATAAVQTAFLDSPMPPWARLIPPGRPAREVRPNRALVGRSSQADVHLEEPEISRRHALLWREAGGIWVADLGSSNGTCLNGEPLAEVGEVADGDLLSFGNSHFVFRSV
ncbi:MAG TPA: FhaA domain-containing protein [Acidimicrobiia bacterium]|nr:FhaA domain-containing protein [Acidimicrobiia bacterium]